ncbi:MAG: hypothetical protein ACRECZ_01820 [Methylocella sp.]
MWTGGNDVSKSTRAPIQITAKYSIASDPGEPFDTWISFGAATSTDKVLTVPAGGNAWVLASYRAKKVVPLLIPNLYYILKWPKPEPDPAGPVETLGGELSQLLGRINQLTQLLKMTDVPPLQ